MSSPINMDMIQSALNKVAKANHIELGGLKKSLSEDPNTTVSAFESLAKLDSIDDKYKEVIANFPHLQSHVSYLIETSILL